MNTYAKRIQIARDQIGTYARTKMGRRTSTPTASESAANNEIFCSQSIHSVNRSFEQSIHCDEVALNGRIEQVDRFHGNERQIDCSEQNIPTNNSLNIFDQIIESNQVANCHKISKNSTRTKYWAILVCFLLQSACGVLARPMGEVNVQNDLLPLLAALNDPCSAGGDSTIPIKIEGTNEAYNRALGSKIDTLRKAAAKSREHAETYIHLKENTDLETHNRMWPLDLAALHPNGKPPKDFLKGTNKEMIDILVAAAIEIEKEAERMKIIHQIEETDNGLQHMLIAIFEAKKDQIVKSNDDLTSIFEKAFEETKYVLCEIRTILKQTSVKTEFAYNLDKVREIQNSFQNHSQFPWIVIRGYTNLMEHIHEMFQAIHLKLKEYTNN